MDENGQLQVGCKYPILIGGKMLHLIELISCNGDEVQAEVVAYENEWSPTLEWEYLPSPIPMSFSSILINPMEVFHG